MKKIILLIVFLKIALVTVHAQSIPTVTIALSEESAAINQTVMANVYIDTELEMVGADVTVAVDDNCLEISGEYVQGPYFTPGDGNSVVLFEEVTSSSARVAVNMLNFDLNPTAGDLFFSVPVTIKCESGSPTMSVTEAHLVQRGIIEFKLSEDEIVASETTLQIADAVQDISEPTATAIPPTAVRDDSSMELIEELPEDSSMNVLVWVAVAFIALAVIGILGLFVMSRRIRKP